MRVHTTMTGLFPASLFLFSVMGSKSCMDQVTEEWDLSGVQDTSEAKDSEPDSDTGSDTNLEMASSDAANGEEMDSATIAMIESDSDSETETVTEELKSSEPMDKIDEEDFVAVDTAFDTPWPVDGDEEANDDPLVDTDVDTALDTDWKEHVDSKEDLFGFETSVDGIEGWDSDVYRDTAEDFGAVDTAFDTSPEWSTDAYRDTAEDLSAVDTSFDTSQEWSTDAYRDTGTEQNLDTADLPPPAPW